jgi:hypothetical protein
MLGVSIWVTVLLDKYLCYRPTYRLLADLRTHGLDLALGTLTDGLQRLVPLFEPLYEALIVRSRQQALWHADETRWLVLAMFEGKVGYRWYLWVFHTREVAVFVLAAGRAHDVPEEHLGPDAHGTMVVDRYKAYQVIEQVKGGQIVLAFCWAHVRRDFKAAARTWPAQFSSTPRVRPVRMCRDWPAGERNARRAQLHPGLQFLSALRERQAWNKKSVPVRACTNRDTDFRMD